MEFEPKLPNWVYIILIVFAILDIIILYYFMCKLITSMP